MKLVVVGGPPSVGKTQVIIHTLGHLQHRGLAVRAVKLDCLVANDADVYARRDIEAVTGLSTYVCPDHYLATNMDRIVAWGTERGSDVLVVESAGLCNRCSPYLADSMAIAIMDTLSGTDTPRKVGPLLRSADVVVLTRGDLVSQAEREVFRVRVAVVNRKARIIEVNGLTGQGSRALAGLVAIAPDLDPEMPLRLRYSMPSAVCSFCLGEKRLGVDHASGNVRLMELPAGPTHAARRGRAGGA